MSRAWADRLATARYGFRHAATMLGWSLACVAVCCALVGCSGMERTEVRFDDVVVKAVVADTPAERDRGLQGREMPGADEGMLFVWPDEGERTFAIKDVSYPLDLIFMNREGEVVGLGGLDPVGTRLWTGPSPAGYVLEVPAGFIDRHAVEYGDRVVIE